MRADELAYPSAAPSGERGFDEPGAAGSTLRDPLNDRLAQALRRAAYRGESLAVLCLGLDNLALIRERLGHEAGAHLLADSARRLQACVQGHGTVARLNDQEFAVVFDEAGNAANVGALCEGLCAVMAPSLTLQGRQVHGQLSIGIALFPQDGADAATLLCLAGEARACARENGGGKYQFFSARMNQRSLARTSMEMALRLAIARDELQLQYQPLADLQSGAIAGMEALLRWQPPSGEMADAGHFLPMAED